MPLKSQTPAFVYTHFAQRLNHFAPIVGVQWRRLSLSSARTRWGSARSDGSIRLNRHLFHLRPELLDYVVVHELSHLREMNHSPRFWAVVCSVLPDYANLRKELKNQRITSSTFTL
jgi:hypothetical protein